ncbi:MAG: amidophosphoribosyltransferase [Planctomycetaceae bacterium]
MSELYHECGVAAVYHMREGGVSRFVPRQNPFETARLIPELLMNIQNRGQLAAGMTSYNPERNQLIDTHKDVGTVTEVFHRSHPEVCEKLMREYAGTAAIGHVRYATCGKDDRSYAQPFERHHIQKSKWFSFGFNGQLANYQKLRDEVLSSNDFHLARETDTEILMHLISQEIAVRGSTDLFDLLFHLNQRLDGAYNMVFLNAVGDMFVSRDPLGIRPLCYAVEGPLFAAASESVALYNLGFSSESIKDLPPGSAAIIQNNELQIRQYAPSPNRAHCFFEWIYFANVASRLDDRSVYLTRKSLGEELARMEEDVDDDTIVVPVPDTAKAAAASMAYQLNVPCLEGLIRNRYVGRTFIEGGNRADKARAKYTPLPEVLAGKRVLLVEDTIVRSTTMKALVNQLKERGKAREVHVRVACPPIVAPCFYGIDMSTVDELFAPKFLQGGPITPAIEAQMAAALGADSLRYLPIESIARCVGLDRSHLCQACIDGNYPTESGRELYQIALDISERGDKNAGRTYDLPVATATRT